MLDSLVMVLLVFMGLRDDRRGPNDAQTSLFRTRDPDRGPTKAVPPPRPWEFDGEDFRQ